MRIVVCVKQVPDTTDVRVDPEKGTLIREGVPSMINPFDQFALEEGLRVRDRTGGELIVLSMGPPQAKSVIMLSLAIGADRGILLTDRAFAGADTLATAYTLSKAIEKVGDVDLVVCGLQAIDGDTAQVGPGIATRLRMPQVTYAERIEVVDGTLRARRVVEDGNETVEARLPALATMTTPSDFVPTNPPFTRIMKAKGKPYEEWKVADLDADPGRLGLDGSPTWVEKVYPPPKREKGEMLEGAPDEIVGRLVEILKQERVL
ncbi:MAG: electron transfer flavoprotein subunit beta/FixA family protein [Thermoplasmata archaeon]|nr:electron transfer flavoprotein subunit beta/FixA family protein [Thermoplasmata archaeon]